MTLSLPPEDQPAPAGAELLGGGLVEGLFEGLEVAEVGGDLRGDGAGGRAADAVRADRAHQGPEGGVVGVAAAVVLTAVRISSGTFARSRIRSSTDLAARSGWLASSAFRLLT